MHAASAGRSKWTDTKRHGMPSPRSLADLRPASNKSRANATQKSAPLTAHENGTYSIDLAKAFWPDTSRPQTTMNGLAAARALLGARGELSCRRPQPAALGRERGYRGSHLARADRGGEHGAHGPPNWPRVRPHLEDRRARPPGRQTIESTSGPTPHHAGLPAERAGRRDAGGVLGDGTPGRRAASAPAGDRAQHAAEPRTGPSRASSSTWKPAPPPDLTLPRRDSHPTPAPSTSPISGASGRSVVRATTMPRTRPATAPSAIATPRP